MAEAYRPGIGFAAGMLMVKWDELDKQMQQQVIHIMPGDNVNVFINFECVLRNISQRKNLVADLSYYKKEMCIELESSIMNMIAHYRGYFKIKYKANPSIYLYYTDLLSDTEQEMSVYNKYYRSYYKNRYLQNPQLKNMGEVLTGIVIPEISLILSYIPGCYFVSSDNFDSSLVPYIVSGFSDNKNVIISADIFDSLYMYKENFITIYANRRFQYFVICSSPEEVVRSIIKEESPFDLTIFNSKMYFQLLLAIKGSRIRNIKSAKGFGYSRFIKILTDGIRNGLILNDFSSINSIIDVFPEQYRNDIKTAFICTSIETQAELLNETNSQNVCSQIVDKIDLKSVEALNNKRFFQFPINLPYLIN